jgi:hypothetical protein
MKPRKNNEYFEGIKKGLKEALAFSQGGAVGATIRIVSINKKRKPHRKHSKA